MTIQSQLRHLLLGMGNDLSPANLQRFYLKQYEDYLLTKGELEINGEGIDLEQRREIIRNYLAALYDKTKKTKVLPTGDIINTIGIELTEEVFIEKLIAWLSIADVSIDNKLLNKVRAYERFLKNKVKATTKPIPKNALTHREEMLIFKYKANAGYISKTINAAEIARKFGNKRRQAYYSTWNDKGKNYIAPKEKELNRVIPRLIDFPNAQKGAINDLDTLRNKL